MYIKNLKKIEQGEKGVEFTQNINENERNDVGQEKEDELEL